MASTPSQSSSTLSSLPHPPHHRPSQNPKKAPSSSSRSDLGDRDEPHHQFSPPPPDGIRATTEEPPLETGEPYLPPSASALPPKEFPARFPPTHPQASVFSLLIFATIWGVLARLGLIWVGGFGDREVFALILAQAVGCLVMGFVVERKKGIEKMCVAPFPPFSFSFFLRADEILARQLPSVLRHVRDWVLWVADDVVEYVARCLRGIRQLGSAGRNESVFGRAFSAFLTLPP
jgi:hypothetical protein